ncbi:MAG: response regulator [Opitutaceae bacterium]|nr:response regulator [Opitutaceae bacterium]
MRRILPSDGNSARIAQSRNSDRGLELLDLRQLGPQQWAVHYTAAANGVIRTVVMAALLGLLPVSAHHIEGGRFADHYIVDNWDVDSGFPFIAVTSLAQTPDGYLWTGSYSGLAKFDGWRVLRVPVGTTEALRAAMVIGLAVDQGGGLWAATSAGVAWLKDGQWHDYGPSAGLPASMVHSLCTGPRGEVVVAVGREIFHLVDGRFEPFTWPLPTGIGRKPFKVAFDRDGMLWALSEDILACWTEGRWQVLLETPGGHTDASFLGLGVAQSGGLWVADGSALHLWKDGALIKTMPRMAGHIGEAVQIFETTDGRVWTAGYLHGVVVYDQDGRPTECTMRDGLLNNACLSLFQDDESNIWVGSNGGGLARIRQRQFQTFDEAAGMAQPVVNAIFETAPGKLLVGTHGGGLLPFTKVRFGEPIVSPDRDKGLNAQAWVNAVVEQPGVGLWVGAYRDGLSLLRDGNVSQFNEDALGSASVYALFLDSRNRLWIGTSRGVLVRDNGEFTRVYQSPAEDVRFYSFGEDADGVIWVISLREGLWRYQADTFTRVTTLAGRAVPVFNCMHRDDHGSFWLGADDGTLWRHGTDGWFVYGESQGVASYDWTSLLTDLKGDLWLGSANGIAHLARKTLDDIAVGQAGKVRFQLFNRADGMKSAACRAGYGQTALRAADGRLWFATIKGMVTVDPAQTDFNPRIPRLHIEEVRDGETKLELPHDPTQAVRIPAGTQRVNIRYSGVSLSYGLDTRFIYRLEGVDTDWVRAGIERVARLPDLRPGNYTFRVRAISREGRESEEVAVRLNVGAFFWQTLWFRAGLSAGLVLALLLALWLSLRWYFRREGERLMQSRALNAERARSARVEQAMEAAAASSRAKSEFLATMSHEIRTPLNGVIGSADMLVDSALNRDQREHMTTLRASAESLLAVLNDILDFSKIESGHIVIERIPFDLSQPLRDVLEVMVPRAAAKNIELVLQLPLEVPLQVVGDPDRLRQVLLNLVGNATKFTESGHVLLKVELLPPQPDDSSAVARLKFSVVDTGVGIAPEAQPLLFERFTQADTSTTRKYGGTGLGLAICKRLVELMGGAIGVRSILGKGAEFTFEICLGRAETPVPDVRIRHDEVIVLDAFPPAAAAAVALAKRCGYTARSASTPSTVVLCLAEIAKSARLILFWDGRVEFTTDEASALRDAIAADRLRVVKTVLRPQQVASESEPFPVAAVLRKPLLNPDNLAEAADWSHAPLGVPGLHSPRPPAPAEIASKLAGARVLVVDDDAVNRLVISKQLEQLGCVVERAQDGAEAVALARLHHYHVILMDCRMPVMDGYTATREIRRALVDTPPIIAITANTTIEDREACHAAGMVDFVSKPVRKFELQRVLAQWLRPGAKP